MSIPFQDSETAKNLLRAFAGESQARNRYDFAANLCQKQELQAMAFIFQATAKQEQAHARVFWDHLQALNGQNLPIYGAYPIEGTNRILELLRAAQHNEHEEHGSVYPSFAAIATQEGFPEAAASFRQIAAIEQLHGERFGLLADQLESGALFVSQIEPKRHAAGVLHIIQRAACAAAGASDVLVAVQGHGGADTVPPLLLHEGSGDAGINAAAHCNQNLFHQTMGQPPSQCSQSGNLLWS